MKKKCEQTKRGFSAPTSRGVGGKEEKFEGELRHGSVCVSNPALPSSQQSKEDLALTIPWGALMAR